MVLAEEMLKKDRGWNWTDSAGLASFLLQMSTSDLSDLKNLQNKKKELEGLFKRDNNYPYSEEYFRKKQKEAIKVFGDAWNQFLEDMRTVNLGNGSGMMNEGLRTTRQNSAEYNSKSRIKS